MKVLIWAFDYVCADQEAEFAKAGVDIIRVDFEDREGMIKAANEHQVDVLMEYSQGLDEATINALPDSVKCIITMFVGFDNIAVDAATARGIMVCNNPAYGSQEVAAQAITMLLNLNRKIYAYDREMREEGWVDDLEGRYKGHRLSDMTLGVIGLSRIGSYAARLGKGLGMHVVSYDPYLPDSRFEEEGVDRVDLDGLLAESDAITIHVPLMDSTYHMINEDAIDKMKDGVLFVNTARAGLVDDDALVGALETGKVAAAGIDVFLNEPDCKDNPYRNLDNVILTPHSAWYTYESERDVDILAADLAISFTEGKVPYSCINRKALGLQ